MKVLLAACLVLVFSHTAYADAAIKGRARVIDGDTLAIGEVRIRMHGIDAPEDKQRCRGTAGQRYNCSGEATTALRQRIGGRPIICTPTDQDQYGRTVARCSLDQVDLSAWMVSHGHAMAFRRYSADYVSQEDSARSAKLGIWAGTFTPPWQWRADRRESVLKQAEQTSAPEAACPIKGNINRKGQHIFHVPGTRDYARTKINPKAGERWFCSEAEARTAGWRSSR